MTFESYHEKASIPLHETFPLHDDEPLSSDPDSENNSDAEPESELDPRVEDLSMSEEIPLVWSHMTGKSALGVWEQHTRVSLAYSPSSIL